MSLDERLVELERAGGSSFGASNGLWPGNQADANPGAEPVGFSKTRMCSRIARVFRNRVLEVLDRLGKRLRSAFVQEVTTLEIRLIRVHFARCWFARRFF